MAEAEELFTTQMRKATRKVHSISDGLVNAKFAISLSDETVWGGGLLVFYYVFAYLEDATRRLNEPKLEKLFIHRILYRKEAFESDLTHYLGPDWRTIPRPAAVDNYIEHLKNIEKESPLLLLAYVYHLYLGLLSGGQILAKKRGMFGGENISKTAYIDQVTDFSDINLSDLKKQFRTAMNEIASTLTTEQKEALIEESKHVFLMNNLIVDSVSGQNRVLKSLLYKASAVVVVVLGLFLAYRMHK